MSVSDDEIRLLIRKRYPNRFRSGPLPDEPTNFVETRGRKSTPWRNALVKHVDARIKDGVTANQACREFQSALPNNFNITVSEETVIDAYRSAKGRPYRGKAPNYFSEAVLQEDMDAAIFWFRHLTANEKKAKGF